MEAKEARIPDYGWKDDVGSEVEWLRLKGKMIETEKWKNWGWKVKQELRMENVGRRMNRKERWIGNTIITIRIKKLGIKQDMRVEYEGTSMTRKER